MRSIGTILSEQEALRFTGYLKKLGIAHTCEPSLDTSGGFISYQVWVHDEDRLDEAKLGFEQFLQNPADSIFDIPLTQQTVEEPPSIEPEERAPVVQKVSSYLTSLIIALCTLVFFVNTYQEIPLLEEGVPEAIFSFTPIQTTLLYDLPPFFEKLTELMQKHPAPTSQPLSPELQADIDSLPSAAYWRGVYDWVVLRWKTGDSSSAEGPLWVKIRQGEIWRLVSPCVLHAGILHILFNMLWVWVLCRPVEERLGIWKTLFFMAIVAIGSNTFQYLMGGPFFLGYSGVVMGLAGLIWSRQKVAPWEGYPIHPSTLFFLLLFVLAMFALQLVSFILQMFSNVQFLINIANTAHISGALLGVLLGRLRFFSWRVAR